MSTKKYLEKLIWAVVQGIISGIITFIGLKIIGVW